MRSKKILFAIALAVIVSGCVTADRKPIFDANNGIIINEFSAEPMPANGGGEVTFFADIENAGGATARNVDVTLLGVDNPWKKNDNPVTKDDVTRRFDSMNPPSIDNRRPGDFKIANFILKTPNMPEGVKADFPVIARVTFEYSSSATMTMPAYSSALYAVKKNKGEVVDIQPRLENSHAPVQVRITRAPVPLIVDEKRGGNEIATFIFELVDVGSGSPLVMDQSNAIGLLNGRMTVTGPGVSFSDCLGQRDGNKIEPVPLDLIRLRSDRRVPFGCSIKIDRSQWQSASKSDSIVFIIELQYFYFVEKSVEVPVIGTG